MLDSGMSLDPSQRARTVVNRFGSPLIAGALCGYPRSVASLQAENVIAPALALAAMTVCTGIALEWCGMRQGGVMGMFLACFGLLAAAVSAVRIHEERLFAAWTVAEGLRRGWLAAEADGPIVRLIERTGRTFATLRASHPCANFVVQGFGAATEDRAAA